MSESVEELRRQDVELQKKQLFAERVAAAAATATAVAAAHSAATLAGMRREASEAALATTGHNSRMEEIARHQAEEEARQREFTRDVVWLERSDVKDRFDYLATKIQKQFVENFVLSALNKLKIIDPQSGLSIFNSGTGGEWPGFTSALGAFVEADCEARRMEEARLSIESKLGEASQLVKEANPHWGSFGFVASAYMLGCLSMFGPSWGGGAEDERTIFAIGAAICGCAILAFGIYSLGAQDRKRVGSAKVAELRPKAAQASMDLKSAEDIRQKTLMCVKEWFAAWAESCESTIAMHIKTDIERGAASALFLDHVEAMQKKYPSLCRIDLKTVGSETVNAFILPIQTAVVARSLHHMLEPDSILEELEHQPKSSLTEQIKRRPSLLWSVTNREMG